MDDFTTYYASLLDGAYTCVDRIVVDAYYPLGQTAGGFRTWWRTFQRDDELTTKHLLRFAARFSRSARAWAREHGIPVIFCRKGVQKVRMHKVAEAHLPKDPSFRGVFLVLVSREPGPVWQVGAFPSGAMDLRARQPWPYVNYYYFHLIDPDWGHVAIGVCSHPPFRARILLNGHEWVARQATHRGLAHRKLGNCFVDVQDPQALTALADRLTDQHIRAVCERWIYGLCFGLSVAEQRLSNFRYAYSVAQVEDSYNLLFTSPRTMDDVYQRVIDQTRRTLTPRTIRTVFGRVHRGQYPKWVEVRLNRPQYNMTIMKVLYGTTTIKLYDKDERVLRIEGISANTSHLRVGRSLERFPRMVAALRAYTIAFLNQLHAAHHAFLDYGTLDTLRQSTTRGSRRIPGLDMDKPRCRALLQAVTTLAPAAEGFTNADFRAVVQSIVPADTPYSARTASYDLAKLVAKDIIVRAPRTRRYILTPTGMRTAVGLLVLRGRLLEPILSGIRLHPQTEHPENLSPLDQKYLALGQALEEVCREIGIAA